jgi:uncharacterized protein YndB with AHSA1/START domain
MDEQPPTEPADQHVVVNRVFDAPRQLVFQAWTDPDQIARWWGPEGFESPREKVSIDLRPGGRYDKVMAVASAEIASAMGVEVGTELSDNAEIVEVVEPELLVFRSEAQPDVGLPVPTITRVQFEDDGEAKTRVTITSGPYTETMRPHAETGWTESLDKLDRLLRTR